MSTCPTCGRRPSERHAIATTDARPEFFNCQDVCHDLADAGPEIAVALRRCVVELGWMTQQADCREDSSPMRALEGARALLARLELARAGKQKDA